MLPTLLPDMTMYSFVAMAHRLESAGRVERTSEKLFGHPTCGLKHDFPSNLDEFCLRSGLAYGSPEYIAEATTILLYFLRFRPPETKQMAVKLIRGQSAEKLKFVLGLPPSPSRSFMPLGYCEECGRADIDLHGVAYWHRRHQLPGVYLCTEHQTPIRYASIRTDGNSRTKLSLPCDINMADLGVPEIPVKAMPVLLQVSHLSDSVLNNELPGGFHPQILQATYRHGLKQHGFLTRSGRLRATDYVHWLRDQYGGMNFNPIFNRIIGDDCIEGMLRLVRKPRGHHHSLSHILLINALFGNWELFSSTYSWEAQMELPLWPFEQEAQENKSVEHQPEAEQITELAARISQEGQSISRAAKELGLNINTAMRQLGKQGISIVSRRPKVLTCELRSDIIQSLKDGLPQIEIARSSGLSKATIDRVCCEEPGLHEQWRLANFELKRMRSRAKLEQIMLDNSRVSSSELRKISESGYSWLVRNDGDWLRETLGSRHTESPIKKKNVKFVRRQRVDWNCRDEECLKALESIRHSVEFKTHERLKPGRLLNKLSGLSFKPRLEKLPRTWELVKEVLAEARVRRIAS